MCLRRPEFRLIRRNCESPGDGRPAALQTDAQSRVVYPWGSPLIRFASSSELAIRAPTPLKVNGCASFLVLLLQSLSLAQPFLRRPPAVLRRPRVPLSIPSRRLSRPTCPNRNLKWPQPSPARRPLPASPRVHRPRKRPPRKTVPVPKLHFRLPRQKPRSRRRNSRLRSRRRSVWWALCLNSTFLIARMPSP